MYQSDITRKKKQDMLSTRFENDSIIINSDNTLILKTVDEYDKYWIVLYSNNPEVEIGMVINNLYMHGEFELLEASEKYKKAIYISYLTVSCEEMRNMLFERKSIVFPETSANLTEINKQVEQRYCSLLEDEIIKIKKEIENYL